MDDHWETVFRKRRRIDLCEVIITASEKDGESFKVLDGKYFVPQHRERIIIVGFKNSIYNGNEKFELIKILFVVSFAVVACVASMSCILV
jgi:site-specific DNA-cytosine methylase